MSRLLAASVLALFFLGASAHAQDFDHHDYRHHMDWLHDACDHGDRDACIKFGIEIGRHQDRYEEWHHVHPEFMFQIP
jgi:hypothetical protein